MFLNPLSIGLDIGNFSIKLVVIELRKRQPVLLAFEERVLSSPILNDQHSVDSEALLSEMRQIRRSIPKRARRVSMALPDSAVISKVVHLDQQLSDQEKHFAVHQALATSSPFPVEELQLDYFAVNIGEGSSASSVAHQVYACRKQTVAGRINALTKARFRPSVLELKSHGLIWLGEAQQAALPTQQNWAVVDIGMKQSDFCVGVSQNQFYRREIPLSVGQISLTNPRFDWQHPDLGACQQFMQQLAEQLRRQIQLYNSTHPKSPLNGIWLAGGASTLVDCDDLAQMLSMPVQWSDPFAVLTRADKLAGYRPEQNYSRFGLATGLALRGAQA
ncbi:type IV pilus assembly protein PilM [Thaumasiovibrio subtropicus]|uniref:type IV pilus assembly protein PilM n=1 Tax=Thaumasiovibrio subtropicus TaxID=1891207 RepID=UPI000B3554D2|nr:type IV pilus assembly protein PilM [Thaumasiovibrio subtropicus]